MWSSTEEDEQQQSRGPGETPARAGKIARTLKFFRAAPAFLLAQMEERGDGGKEARHWRHVWSSPG